MAEFNEYTEYDALGLAELIRHKSVSPLEVLDAAIHQVEQLNPQLNAIIHTFYDRARKVAQSSLEDGPFAGVPFLLKDLQCCFAGEPMTMGSRGINWIPNFDSELTKRYKHAGLNIFGKTNTPEYGLIITTEPKAHGPTHNPHLSGYSSGGSSGGSAAAVVSKMVPMAHAGDGGGSIRIPAAWCGAFGLKPSRGRNPMGPERGEDWSGAVAEHAITRSVRDSAALLDCTHGPDIGAPFTISQPKNTFLSATQVDPGSLKIAVSETPHVPTTVSKEITEALENTAKQLESMGHQVEYRDPPINTQTFWRSFFIVIAGHGAATYDHVKKQFGKTAANQLEPQTKNLAMLGRSFSANDFVNAINDWQATRHVMGEFMSDYDILLCPTMPVTAVKHGVLPPSPAEEWLLSASSHINIGKLSYKLGLVDQLALPVLEMMTFSILGNVTGLPCMSMPLHRSEKGLPIGIQAYGRMSDELTLFSLAASLESEFLI